MPIVGICRCGMDNNYLFVAEDEPKPGRLTNVSFYHDANSTYGFAFRSQFPAVELIYEDRALATDGRIVFSGDDLIRTYAISPEVYDDIFDHSRDAERLLEYIREKLETGHEFVLGCAVSRGALGKPPLARNAIESEFLQRKNYIAEHPPRQEDTEYSRALHAACEAGFNEMFVNGQPRAVGSIIPISQLV